MTTVHLLQAFPDVAEHYRRRFRHVLVDEYQDTNHAQYVAGRASWSAPATDGPCRRPSCASSATPTSRSTPSAARRSATSCEFERTTPTPQTILLEQNYRSTQTILTAANAVIARNTDRKPKRLWTDAGDGEPIVGYVADNEHDEAAWVAQEIDRLRDEGAARPADVAVFYRTNAQSRVFEEVFIRVGLPYKVVGGVRFYERRRSATRWPTCGWSPTPRTRSACAGSSTPRAAGIGDRAEACVEALAARERISFGAALRRADEAPGLATRSLTAIEDFVALLDESLRTLAEAGTGPAEVLGGACSTDRLPRRAARRAATRRTRRGSRTSRSSSAVAREFERGARRRRASRPPRRLPRAGRRWSPTPTRSRTPTPTPTASSP